MLISWEIDHLPILKEKREKEKNERERVLKRSSTYRFPVRNAGGTPAADPTIEIHTVEIARSGSSIRHTGEGCKEKDEQGCRS
jgi:hypothetical protein